MYPTWQSMYPTWQSMYPTWQSMYTTWQRMYTTWQRMYTTWQRMYTTWLSMYTTWPSMYTTWPSMYTTWQSMYKTWAMYTTTEHVPVGMIHCKQMECTVGIVAHCSNRQLFYLIDMKNIIFSKHIRYWAHQESNVESSLKFYMFCDTQDTTLVGMGRSAFIEN